VNLRDLGGTAQDSKAEKALDALKKLAPECAMVLRNGSWQSTLDRARSAGRFFLRKKKTSGKLTSISKEKRFLFGKLSIDGGCSIIIYYYLCLFSGGNPPKWELQPQVGDDVVGYHEMGGETC
jgi:hypothetical protein